MSTGESPSAVTGLKSQALGNTWGDAALGEATCKAVATQVILLPTELLHRGHHSFRIPPMLKTHFYFSIIQEMSEFNTSG